MSFLLYLLNTLQSFHPTPYQYEVLFDNLRFSAKSPTLIFSALSEINTDVLLNGNVIYLSSLTYFVLVSSPLFANHGLCLRMLGEPSQLPLSYRTTVERILL